MRYYGFLFWCHPWTTTGEPNKKTGQYSIAGEAFVFDSKESREKWLREERTSGLGKGERVAVTKKTLRSLLKGYSMEEFNMYVESLQFGGE